MWKAIEELQIKSNINIAEWRRSYQGTCAVMKYLNFEIVITQEQFEKLEIPCKNNSKNYLHVNNSNSKW